MWNKNRVDIREWKNTNLQIQNSPASKRSEKCKDRKDVLYVFEALWYSVFTV